MENPELYRALALRLDTFPQSFPPTPSGVEFELLAYLFSPEEARLAAQLPFVYESLKTIAEANHLPLSKVRYLALSMAKKGLIYLRKADDEIQIRLLPFVIGFYENQTSRMDEVLAHLCEAYFREANFNLLSLEPQFHRVIPINESVKSHIEILPEDNVIQIISNKKAWAVTDCICRKQKSLIGEGCEHPIRMCLVMSDTPGVFEGLTGMDALTLEEAIAILNEAAAAGLVHTIANHKDDIGYVCNCCTCSCGMLRAIAEAGIANVVARSAYVAQVDDSLCVACGICVEKCQFGAISVVDFAEINPDRCVGCGLCTRACPETAISISIRPAEEILPVPYSFDDWLAQRAASRCQS